MLPLLPKINGYLLESKISNSMSIFYESIFRKGVKIMDLFEGMPSEVKEIIKDSVTGSVLVSPAGALVPAFDTAAIILMWGSMLYRIGVYYEVDIPKDKCIKVLTCCGTSITAYLAGTKIINWTLNLIPGIGTLGAMAGNCILNGYYTYAVGRAFNAVMREPGINRFTAIEIAKLLMRHFVPIPSLATLKEIFALLRTKLPF